MTPESELILGIAKKTVYNERNKAPSLIKKEDNIDWSRLKDSLNYHGLLCFAYLSLKNSLSLLPLDLINVLEATYYHYLRYSAYLEQEFLTLYTAFEDKNIVLIPIKGVALLEDLYADFPIRPSTDIDVLVREEDVDQGARILEDLGFKKELEGLKESYWRKKQYHLVFVKKKCDSFPLIAELHWDLDYRRKRRQLLPGMFNRLREFTIQNRKVKLLSCEDTFFSLALHQRRFGKALALRDVCDMARLLNKYALTFDWDYVLEESQKAKVCTTIFFALCQVDLLLEVNIPQFVWKKLNLAIWKRKLIQQFIKKNTFSADQNRQTKNLYLKAHFLLYDSIWEPIDYILNIPPEQFAKFYGLTPYNKKTEFFYKNRLFYIPFKTILNLISKRG
jgi:hypothetical protein